MTRVLIAEDDIYLREELMLTFQKRGYQVFGISSFETAKQQILDAAPNLLILDINLPNKSGFELCKELKCRASFPILILTARDTLSDELNGLELGADDFLIKPCHPDKLLARADRLLQIYQKIGSLIQVKTLALDTDTYKLVWRRQSLILPETEGKILRLLIEKYPLTVSHSEIFSFVWNTEEFVDENIVPVNITRLRKKLSLVGLSQVIRTVRGQGYCLEVEHI